MAVTASEMTYPLCVDLDGTLIRTDLLLESALALTRKNPLYLFMMVYWLLKGRAVLKAEIASRVELNASTLPYNSEFVDWLRNERAQGRSLWLCTAANGQLATAVADQLGLFDGVLASDARTNLAGASKADRLVRAFGERGFDYCGNERRDMAIWRRGRGAIIVNASSTIERAVSAEVAVFHTFTARGSKLKPLLRALRPHQWAKNMLVLVPLLAAHRATDAASLGYALLGLVAFCLCASSVYVLNDLLDLESDRAHPRKSKRPFASGELPISAGIWIAPALLAASIVLALFLPPKFQLVLSAYYLLTLAYSLVLKSVMLIDAVALAGLYTLRVIAGAAAATIALSFWLLLFAVFLFLSLAFVKRYAELDALRRQLRLKALGRGYTVEDLPVLQSLGTAAGYLSVLVLALYINSPDIEALYQRPKAVWLLCVLMLYWISRVWMTAHRGKMHDDPVVFALRDRVSLGIGLLAAVTIAVAI